MIPSAWGFPAVLASFAVDSTGLGAPAVAKLTHLRNDRPSLRRSSGDFSAISTLEPEQNLAP
jgi:hypothetical protein